MESEFSETINLMRYCAERVCCRAHDEAGDSPAAWWHEVARAVL